MNIIIAYIIYVAQITMRVRGGGIVNIKSMYMWYGANSISHNSNGNAHIYTENQHFSHLHYWSK